MRQRLAVGVGRRLLLCAGIYVAEQPQRCGRRHESRLLCSDLLLSCVLCTQSAARLDRTQDWMLSCCICSECCSAGAHPPDLQVLGRLPAEPVVAAMLPPAQRGGAIHHATRYSTALSAPRTHGTCTERDVSSAPCRSAPPARRSVAERSKYHSVTPHVSYLLPAPREPPPRLNVPRVEDDEVRQVLRVAVLVVYKVPEMSARQNQVVRILLLRSTPTVSGDTRQLLIAMNGRGAHPSSSSVAPSRGTNSASARFVPGTNLVCVVPVAATERETRHHAERTQRLRPPVAAARRDDSSATQRSAPDCRSNFCRASRYPVSP